MTTNWHGETDFPDKNSIAPTQLLRKQWQESHLPELRALIPFEVSHDYLERTAYCAFIADRLVRESLIEKARQKGWIVTQISQTLYFD